jgi:tripartite-type tricarboxylate transporter receptor subunit TctC
MRGPLTVARRLVLAGALVAAAPAFAWPDKPVRVVVPAPPGSSLDVIARALAEPLRQRWGQAIVVENRAGAGGMLGMDTVAKAAPDGHVLGVGFNGPIAFGPFMYRKMPYDPATQLVPVVLTTSQPNVLAVSASNPANTVPEFVAWAKAQGDRVNYASVGAGSSSHLTMELFRRAAGFQATHVAYNGSPPAATSLAAGDTQALMTVAPALLPMIQSGRIKLLGATSLKRTEVLKDLPTLAEQGYPGFEALAWNGLFAPAGTPEAVVRRIAEDVTAALAEPAVRDGLAKQGLVAGGGTPADFATFIRAESKTWGAMIREAGITLD